MEKTSKINKRTRMFIPDSRVHVNCKGVSTFINKLIHSKKDVGSLSEIAMSF